jgi:hypothetical protein
VVGEHSTHLAPPCRLAANVPMVRYVRRRTPNI